MQKYYIKCIFTTVRATVEYEHTVLSRVFVLSLYPANIIAVLSSQSRRNSYLNGN